MKKRTIACILVCLLALILSACRADDPVDEMEEAFLPIYTEAELGENAYPAGDEAYPIGEVFLPIDESAYPITEADLAWLTRTWRLASYAEDGIDRSPPIKTLSIKDDGSYIITTGSEQETGMWTTILLAVESSLILNRDNGETQYYQILALGENELILRTQRNNLQIDEEYLPAY
jgi:hypothetical protein